MSSSILRHLLSFFGDAPVRIDWTEEVYCTEVLSVQSYHPSFTPLCFLSHLVPSSPQPDTLATSNFNHIFYQLKSVCGKKTQVLCNKLSIPQTAAAAAELKSCQE